MAEQLTLDGKLFSQITSPEDHYEQNPFPRSHRLRELLEMREFYTVGTTLCQGPQMTAVIVTIAVSKLVTIEGRSCRKT